MRLDSQTYTGEDDALLGCAPAILPPSLLLCLRAPGNQSAFAFIYLILFFSSSSS